MCETVDFTTISNNNYDCWVESETKQCWKTTLSSCANDALFTKQYCLECSIIFLIQLKPIAQFQSLGHWEGNDLNLWQLRKRNDVCNVEKIQTNKFCNMWLLIPLLIRRPGSWLYYSFIKTDYHTHSISRVRMTPCSWEGVKYRWVMIMMHKDFSYFSLSLFP